MALSEILCFLNRKFILPHFVQISKDFVINPFLTNVPILYSLKTLENQKFTGVFRGYKMRALTRTELSWLNRGSLFTLLWLSSLSYRNQSTDLLCKSMDWFLFDRYLCNERVNSFFSNINFDQSVFTSIRQSNDNKSVILHHHPATIRLQICNVAFM